MHPWVKRAFLLSSYALGDEGKHWRSAQTFDEFDAIAKKWMAERVQQAGWRLPV
jgi:hypothetical protein